MCKPATATRSADTLATQPIIASALIPGASATCSMEQEINNHETPPVTTARRNLASRNVDTVSSAGMRVQLVAGTNNIAHRDGLEAAEMETA